MALIKDPESGNRMYDAIIVGGGPAGLSAALLLGRCRRRVLVCDEGMPRNRRARRMHGYLTRDGISPREFLQIARDEIARYGVEFRQVKAHNARKVADGFEVELEGGVRCLARKLLIATGVADQLPPISNVSEFYGSSVHHCPYCDGWEERDKRIAVYARKPGLALALLTWTSDVILFTDGHARIPRKDRELLARRGVSVRTGKIARLEGEHGNLRRVVLENGDAVERDAMFFSTSQHQACDIASGLGCVMNRRGTVETNRLEMSNVPGLYVAGDASRDVQLVIVAAAEGAKAAFAINVALQEDDGLTS
jgi:thioredoxin reductase